MKRDCHSQTPKAEREELVQIGQAPTYWRSLDELQRGPASSGEFKGGLTASAHSRRDFLSLMGFSLTALGLTGCRAPVQHAVPLLAATDQLIPGVPNWYATTCGSCPSSCALVVKQRDGRPIKIEGNEQAGQFGGGTCAAGQAGVLSLYDGE